MKNTLFGTDGIRATVGTPPLTADSLMHLGDALGKWLEKTTSHPNILVGTDTRSSASFVKSALYTGLTLHPVTLYDAGIAPTPTLYSIMNQEPHFDLALVITASHNPYHDNGIKVLARNGQKLDPADEREIERLFFSNNTLGSTQQLGTITTYPNAVDIYINTLRTYFPENFLKGTAVVLDCAHGATYTIAQAVFDHFGATLHIINAAPNGVNINRNCGSLHPQAVQEAVQSKKADIGFAFDGDGDRVIAVNKKGEVKDGDALLGVLLQHPLYAADDALVGTVMSDGGLAAYAQKNNKRFIRTPVGDKYVVQKLQQEELKLGGEPSGHIILRDYLDTDDGIFAALRTAQTMIMNNNTLLNSFIPFGRFQKNIPVVTKKSTTQEPLAGILQKYEQQLPTGRVIVRYSGTEPILRVLVEDQNQERATLVATNLIHDIEKLFASKEL